MYIKKNDIIDTIEYDYYKDIQKLLNDLRKNIEEHFSN